MRNKSRRPKGNGRTGIWILSALLGLIILLVTFMVLYALKAGVSTPSMGYGTERPSEAALHSQPITEPSAESAEITEPTEPSTEPPTEPTVPPEQEAALALLESMTLEEKIYQMFIVTPETLTGSGYVDIAGPMTQTALENYPVGGIVYFSNNIYNATQIQDMIENSQAYSKFPLLICVDEEGGRVSRLSGIGVTDTFRPMAFYGAEGDTETVREIGRTIGSQITSVGFNLDFAPVADVVTNPNNTEIGDRSFSDDPAVAAEMVAAMVSGLHEGGSISCLKHFPGHGSTEADTHVGRSLTDRTLDELRETELLPFIAGIDAGVDMIMVSHMSAPDVNGNDAPCDLSPVIVTDLLREELGFDGVIITDSHEMGAILNYYETGEAAVLAVQAGCDIVLMPYRMQEAANALLEAVENGEITEERINESVLRILTMKYRYGIIEE